MEGLPARPEAPPPLRVVRAKSPRAESMREDTRVDERRRRSPNAYMRHSPRHDSWRSRGDPRYPNNWRSRDDRGGRRGGDSYRPDDRFRSRSPRRRRSRSRGHSRSWSRSRSRRRRRTSSLSTSRSRSSKRYYRRRSSSRRRRPSSGGRRHARRSRTPDDSSRHTYKKSNDEERKRSRERSTEGSGGKNDDIKMMKPEEAVKKEEEEEVDTEQQKPPPPRTGPPPTGPRRHRTPTGPRNRDFLPRREGRDWAPPPRQGDVKRHGDAFKRSRQSGSGSHSRSRSRSPVSASRSVAASQHETLSEGRSGFNIDELLPPPLERDKALTEIETEIRKVQDHRGKAEVDQTNTMRGVRRARHEVELAMLELKSTEERRKAAERVHELAVQGFIAPAM